MIATLAPDSAAVTAAAIPAGPAPITATSKLRWEQLFMGVDFHIFFAHHLATPPVELTVNLHAAFEASTHTTKRKARLA